MNPAIASPEEVVKTKKNSKTTTIEEIQETVTIFLKTTGIINIQTTGITIITERITKHLIII